MAYKLCPCGSGYARRARYDARGYFLAFVCDRCETAKMSKYRPDVLTNPNYDADEAFEED